MRSKILPAPNFSLFCAVPSCLLPMWIIGLSVEPNSIFITGRWIRPPNRAAGDPESSGAAPRIMLDHPEPRASISDRVNPIVAPDRCGALCS